MISDDPGDACMTELRKENNSRLKIKRNWRPGMPLKIAPRWRLWAWLRWRGMLPSYRTR